MEAAICGYKAISLSYAFFSRNHDPMVIGAATTLSVKLMEHLYQNWEEGVDLYSINVPLVEGVEKNKIMFTDMLQNAWMSGSCFEQVDADAATKDPEEHEREIREDEGGADERQKHHHARFKHKHFKWAPRFQDVYESVARSPPGKVFGPNYTRYILTGCRE